MKFPNPEILVYIGLADAYAIATEYLHKEEIDSTLQECLKFERYIAHPRFGTGNGQYTDDTEMSVANARVLIEHDEPFTPIMFANEYVSEFERGGRRKGYSRKLQQILEMAMNGEDLMAQVRPGSYGNGAAMRSVPLGVLPTREKVIAAAEIQASTTHSSLDGLFSSKMVALMSHYSLYEPGPLSDLRDYCLAYMSELEYQFFGWVMENRWGSRPVEDTKRYSVAVNTVAAVLDLVANQDSLMRILQTTLVWGGDTDSVAAIAWGVASSRYQDEALPEFMRADLEAHHPSTNKEYLQRLGTALMDKYAE